MQEGTLAFVHIYNVFLMLLLLLLLLLLCLLSVVIKLASSSHGFLSLLVATDTFILFKLNAFAASKYSQI